MGRELWLAQNSESVEMPTDARLQVICDVYCKQLILMFITKFDCIDILNDCTDSHGALCRWFNKVSVYSASFKGFVK